MKYTEKKQKARETAIKIQIDMSVYACSYHDIMLYQIYLNRLARRYGLVKEFRENGLI